MNDDQYMTFHLGDARRISPDLRFGSVRPAMATWTPDREDMVASLIRQASTHSYISAASPRQQRIGTTLQGRPSVNLSGLDEIQAYMMNSRRDVARPALPLSSSGSTQMRLDLCNRLFLLRQNSRKPLGSTGRVSGLAALLSSGSSAERFRRVLPVTTSRNVPALVEATRDPSEEYIMARLVYSANLLSEQSLDRVQRFVAMEKKMAQSDRLQFGERKHQIVAEDSGVIGEYCEPDDVYFSSPSHVSSFPLVDPESAAAEGFDQTLKQANENFPKKLYRILYETEKKGQSDIISFVANGLAFKIHDQERFVSEVMPSYFVAGRLNTFMKQLGLYSFRRISHGKEKGAYCHEHFVKGQRQKCHRIVRKKTRIPRAVQRQRDLQKEQQGQEDD